VVLAALVVSAQAGSPVGKVLELLNNLKNKVESEGAESEKTHKEFTEWAHSTMQEMDHNLRRNSEKIDALNAAISEAAGNIESLTAKISELSAQIQSNEKDLAEARALRKEQNDAFLTGQKDLEDTIDTLVRANGLLRKAGLGLMQTPAFKATLMQVTTTLSTIMDAAIIDASSRAKLQSLMQAAADGDDEGDAEAEKSGPPHAIQGQVEAYTSHSASIIELLEELKVKAEGELNDLRKEEMTRQHEFEMLEQGLEDSKKTAERDLANSKNDLKTNEENKAQAEGDLVAEETDKSNNESTLAETKASYEQRNEEYAAEVKSRNEEIAAISKAIEILSDPTFSAANAARTASFLQVSARDNARIQVRNLLRKVAREANDVFLTQLAVRVGADPFGKVIGLIRDMLKRLKEQAAKEAEHNAYCVSEKKENEAKRDDIEGKRDNFAVRLEKATAQQTQIKEDIAELAKELAELESAVAEATKIRQEESAAFTKAAEEFRIGLDGLNQAMQVLREYYAQEGTGTHQKASDSASGIISMLEVAEQDMSNSQAEAERAEDSASKAFKKFSQEAEVTKATKQATSKAKEGELARLGEKIADLQSDVDGAQKELDAVLNYLEKLKEGCEHKPQSFADRAAAREKEIDGLKQALEILENETASDDEAAGFLQRK
jgi:hypothetical protein